ncbi:MAG: ABC transporter permease [Bacillota bacterium]
MFIRLGYLNTARNITRSILAIVSMAVAAVILTSTLTISRGYPREAYRAHRQMIGGEIVGYSLKFSGQLPTVEQSEQLKFWRLENSALSDLPVFHPELFTSGYLAQNQDRPRSFQPADIYEIAAQPGVAGLYPYYLMPAHTIYGPDNEFSYQSPLRGRSLELDCLGGGLEQNVVNGLYFTPEDDGRLVAVVSSWQPLPKQAESPTVGSSITVNIPAITYRDGRIDLDFEHSVAKRLDVIGQMELPTRVASSGDLTEQLYWHTTEVQIPLATWRALWKEVGGADYLPYEMAIHVNDLTFLEDTVLQLNRSFPQFTFVSVPKQAVMAGNRNLIERSYTLPAVAMQATEDVAQSGLPQDLRKPLLVLIYLNAALIVAANMLTAVNERKQEMGILKAVGARSWDIMVMALTEAFLLSVIGATLGFLLIRIFGAITQLTNHHSLLRVLWSVVMDYGIVIGSTALASLLFGLLPALKLSRLTAMEVLRND